MKSLEGLMVAAILAVVSLSSPSASRSLPQWSSAAEGSALGPEGDSNFPSKDALYWPSVSGQIPASWLMSLGPREARAENFIRFGRSNADRTLANKKNNFIRLGRENPRQNNFIRLGRGGLDEPLFFSGTLKWPLIENGPLKETPSDYGPAPN